MHIIIGIIGMAIGAAITIYSEKMLNAFGRITFFEKFLGSSGGSRLGYKLIGIMVFFIALLVFTNMIQGFTLWLFSPLIRSK